MRKNAIKILGILNGYLLISIMYVMLMEIVGERGKEALLWSMEILLMMTVCSLWTMKVKNFWMFLLMTGIALIPTRFLVPQGYPAIWVVVACLFVIVFYLHYRITGKETCGLEEPSYPGLILFMLSTLMGSYRESSFLVQLSAFGAGMYYLLCSFHTNLVVVDDFVSTYSHLERFPVRRLGRNNQIMMWIVNGITAVVMILSPYLHIVELVKKAGSILVSFIRWLFSFIDFQEAEQLEELAVEEEAIMEMGEMLKMPLWAQILYKIFEICIWIMAIAGIGAILYFFIRWLIRLYQSFNANTEENGDRIEAIVIESKIGEKRKELGKIKENLFWDMSANGRIRKHYKKKVLRELKNAPDASWTPEQIEERMNLDPEQKRQFHISYEKARYSKEECTKNEMKEFCKL